MPNRECFAVWPVSVASVVRWLTLGVLPVRGEKMKVRFSFVAYFAAAALCFGQSERGNITGFVTDATNAAVPNAPVKVMNTGTNAATSLVASMSGEYSAANLGPGTYRLEVAMAGFQTE